MLQNNKCKGCQFFNKPLWVLPECNPCLNCNKTEPQYVEIKLNNITYDGDTDKEKELNSRLLETLLELNSYQDNYDNMKTVTEIKERLNYLKLLIHEDYVPETELEKYKGQIDILEWVLNNSKTEEEKSQDLPRASKEDVERILNNMKDYLNIENVPIIIIDDI